jgi:hypothetical protein
MTWSSVLTSTGALSPSIVMVPEYAGCGNRKKTWKAITEISTNASMILREMTSTRAFFDFKTCLLAPDYGRISVTDLFIFYFIASCWAFTGNP